MLAPDTNTLVLDGVLDATTANKVLQASHNFFKGKSQVNIDFAEVQYANSVALAIILYWLRQAKKHDIKLKLHNLPQKLISMARLSELDEIILESSGGET